MEVYLSSTPNKYHPNVSAGSRWSPLLPPALGSQLSAPGPFLPALAGNRAKPTAAWPPGVTDTRPPQLPWNATGEAAKKFKA